MDREDINQLLKGYYRYKESMQRLQEKVAILETRATKVTATYDPNKGNIPKNNPKASRVEKNAIKIAEAKEQIEQYEKLITITDDLLRVLRPHQRYLIKCIVANGMTEKEFAKREGIKNPQTIRINLERIYKKLEKAP